MWLLESSMSYDNPVFIQWLSYALSIHRDSNIVIGYFETMNVLYCPRVHGTFNTSCESFGHSQAAPPTNYLSVHKFRSNLLKVSMKNGLEHFLKARLVWYKMGYTVPDEASAKSSAIPDLY